MTIVVTNADTTGRSGWSIADAITQLRVWGTTATFDVRPSAAWTIGAATDCSLRLEDPSGRVSRHHAELARSDDGWTVRDLESTNGVLVDGERRVSATVTPGVELEIGGLTLVAESPRLVVLRELLARLLGWGDERQVEVDRALRAVREMATLRTTLVLCGPGDLTPTARRIHERVLDDVPFVGDRRDRAASLETGGVATVCVHASEPPTELRLLVAQTRTPGTGIRTIVLAESVTDATAIAGAFARATFVEIPSLAKREPELLRLLHEYAVDAAARLGLHATGLREHEDRWLCELRPTTHEEMDELALRVVSMRNGGVTAGAARLGISHVALSRWAQRRGIPT